MPFDYKKEYREFYLPPKKPHLITIPRMNFVAVHGKGDPNGSTNTIIMYLNQHLYSKNYGTAGAISVLMFLLCAVLCVIIYFTLTQEDDGLTREQRKAEKARIKAAKAAAKHH
jgi:cellobiose transport system permease protein